MNGIESFRLRFRNPQHFHAQNAETGMLNHTENVPGRILRDRVRFDDAECTLQRLHYSYESLFLNFFWLKQNGSAPSVQLERAQSEHRRCFSHAAGVTMLSPTARSPGRGSRRSWPATS